MKQGEEAVVVFLDALNLLGLDYMVVGSFSSNRYGVPRATKVADFVLNVAAGDREKLHAALPVAFKVEPQVSYEMVTGTWHQVIQIPSMPFTIELFELSKDLHDQSRFSRRRRLTLLSCDAWLPTPEDVVVQKLRWCLGGRRSKDFDDAVAVMAVQGTASLDWHYIEKWCKEHATLEVLAQVKAEAALAWEDDEAG